jgi:hypothetical protein
MTAARKIASGAGLRHIRYWKTDSDGYPSDDESGQDGYDGRQVEGAKSLTTNIPDNQPIVHSGDDRVIAQDFLPPTSGEVVSLTTAKTNQIVDAELMGHNVVQVGESQMDAFGTDRQGYEISISLLAFRQALVTEEGQTGLQRVYITYLYPSGRMSPKGGPMNEGAADENTYNFIPTPVSKTPWGVAFSQSTHGFTEATRLRFISEYPMMLERFTAPGAQATFNLNFAPVSVAKTSVYNDGTPLTVSSVDASAKTVTLDAAPSASARLVAWYETTDIP